MRDDRPGIFERVPVFFLTVVALFLAASAGIWMQTRDRVVHDSCSKAKLSRDDDDAGDIAAVCDDDNGFAPDLAKTNKPDGSYGKICKEMFPTKGLKGDEKKEQKEKRKECKKSGP